MEGHFLREDHAAYVGPITPGAVSGPSQDTVIAKREALWRSSPAGLDCRAPAGLAMTGLEGRSFGAGAADAATADLSSGADHSSVIAKRGALWRSSRAGLDCRAPTGLAMTGLEGGSFGVGATDAASADVSSDADHSSVIAKREALWRSSRAGLDCRAPAGLAMTGVGRGDHPSALARLQAELDRALERLEDLGEQAEGFVGRVFGAERPARAGDAVDRPAPHVHRLAATGLLIHQALTRVERAVARLGEIG